MSCLCPVPNLTIDDVRIRAQYIPLRHLCLHFRTIFGGFLGHLISIRLSKMSLATFANDNNHRTIENPSCACVLCVLCVKQINDEKTPTNLFSFYFMQSVCVQHNTVIHQSELFCVVLRCPLSSRHEINRTFSCSSFVCGVV